MEWAEKDKAINSISEFMALSFSYVKSNKIFVIFKNYIAEN
jgi:hypothetical protein